MKKGDPLSKIKRIGFILIIILVFTPLSFLVSNTITDNMIVKEETEECWYDRPYIEPWEKQDNRSQVEYEKQQDDMRECEKRNDIIEDKQDITNFIIITIINVIVIISLLILSNKLDDVITYSMFFAAGLNTIIVVMRYISIRSVLGVALGILLFVLLLVFINKNLKKK